VFGLTALLAASEIAFTIVSRVSWDQAVAQAKGPLGEAMPMAGSSSRGVGDAFKRGFFTNILNPKVGVSYVTFLPQFIPHSVNVAASLLVLAGLHVLLTSAWFALLVALTIPLARFLAKPRVVKVLDRLTGLVFVGFDCKSAPKCNPTRIRNKPLIFR
jgi:threonine/homoserine/homoserine lactone efflux protein